MRLRNLAYKWPLSRLYNTGFPYLKGVISFYNPHAIISQVPDCSILLSIGGGTGEIESRISDKDIQVLNHDFSFDMLKEGKRRNSIDGVNGVAELLTYRDNSIDCILINESIGHMKLVETLRESYRVLKEGGKLIINNYKLTLFNLILKYLSPIAFRYKMYSKEEFEETVKNTGFKNTKIDEFDVKMDILPITFISVKATK